MSDTCQTPGCGHAKERHSRTDCMDCPCTRYTAPGPVGQSLAASSLAPAWESDNARRQVLADAEAAWETWATSKGLNPNTHGLFHATFIAGYLAGKGIDQ